MLKIPSRQHINYTIVIFVIVTVIFMSFVFEGCVLNDVSSTPHVVLMIVMFLDVSSTLYVVLMIVLF
jgi:hypothetical protein